MASKKRLFILLVALMTYALTPTPPAFGWSWFVRGATKLHPTPPVSPYMHTLPRMEPFMHTVPRIEPYMHTLPKIEPYIYQFPKIELIEPFKLTTPGLEIAPNVGRRPAWPNVPESVAPRGEARLGELIADMPQAEQLNLAKLRSKIFSADDVAQISVNDIRDLLAAMGDKEAVGNLNEIVIGLSKREKGVLVGTGALCLTFMIMPQQQKEQDSIGAICSSFDDNHPLSQGQSAISAMSRVLSTR